MDEELRQRVNRLKRALGFSSDKQFCFHIDCHGDSLYRWIAGKTKMGRHFRIRLRELEVKYKTTEKPRSEYNREYAKKRKRK